MTEQSGDASRDDIRAAAKDVALGIVAGHFLTDDEAVRVERAQKILNPEYLAGRPDAYQIILGFIPEVVRERLANERELDLGNLRKRFERRHQPGKREEALIVYNAIIRLSKEPEGEVAADNARKLIQTDEWLATVDAREKRLTVNGTLAQDDDNGLLLNRQDAFVSVEYDLPKIKGKIKSRGVAETFDALDEVLRNLETAHTYGFDDTRRKYEYIQAEILGELREHIRGNSELNVRVNLIKLDNIERRVHEVLEKEGHFDAVLPPLLKQIRAGTIIGDRDSDLPGTVTQLLRVAESLEVVRSANLKVKDIDKWTREIADVLPYLAHATTTAPPLMEQAVDNIRKLVTDIGSRLADNQGNDTHNVWFAKSVLDERKNAAGGEKSV